MLLKEKLLCHKINYLVNEGLKHSKILISLFLKPNHLPICTGDKKMGKKFEQDGSNRNVNPMKNSYSCDFEQVTNSLWASSLHLYHEVSRPDDI